MFAEAAGNYVHVCLGPESLLTRSSLNRLESLLNGERFVRIHRSAIVNLDQICHMEPQPGGEYIVTLNMGKQLKASRRHVSALLRSLRGGAPEVAEDGVFAQVPAREMLKPGPRLYARA